MSENVTFLHDVKNKSVVDGKRVTHEEFVIHGSKGLTIKFFHKDDKGTEKVVIYEKDGKYMLKEGEGESKKEGEKRRKEFEERSRSYAGRATGGQAFIEEINLGKEPAPAIAKTTVLGLPRNTSAFTKFGESINRAANLTFSSPQTRFGGM